jgi:hypothetical protein
MPQSGYTPIQIYSSSSAGNTPSAGNLTNDTKGAELAINIADGKLFYKDASNVVQVLANASWSGTVTSVGATAPIASSGGTTPTISISQATTSTNGYLSSTDWNTFNNKQPALVSGTNLKTVSGTSLLGSGDLGTIGATYGGTGQSSYTTGDLLYASSSTALAKLADVATGNALISGGVGAAPYWGKIDLTTHVSGTLPVGNGGTGQASTLTQYGLVYAATTTAMGSTAAGTSSQVLIGNASGAPTWSGTPSITSINAGNMKLSGNTLESTNTNGSINITPNGTGDVVQSQSSNTRYWNIATTHPGYLGYGGIVELGITTNQYGNIGAQIRPRAYGNVNEQKIGLSFFVQAGASASATPRMHITEGGVIMPAVDGTQNIGTNSFYDGSSSVNMRWNTIYATNGTINTSDGREKTDIQESDLGLAFIQSLQPVSYRWISPDPAVAWVKNEDGGVEKIETPKAKGRKHYGLIAQQLAQAALANNVDLDDFAIYIEGDPKNPESSKGLRYHELISPMIKAIQELKAEFDEYKKLHP